MKTCENCRKEHETTYGSGRFCSSKCARGFSTKDKRLIINKKISNTLKKHSKKTHLCVSCAKGITKMKSSKCKYCEKCKSFLKYKTLFSKLGIIETNILLATERALEKLLHEYCTNKKSAVDIKKEYKIQTNTLYYFFKKNNVQLRNISESIRQGYLDGTRYVSVTNTPYKRGIHKTWDGKNVYFRSSYELDYCKVLDAKNVEYQMEKIRVKYFDSLKKIERVAIPDFYIPSENMLVEIKSKWTLDKNNMKDKFLAYEKEGYNVKLIVDGKEISLS